MLFAPWAARHVRNIQFHLRSSIIGAMDGVSGLIDGPRARGAFALRTVMQPPWSLRILAESPLTLIAVVSGEVWLVPDGGVAMRLRAGDIGVTRAPEHYNVASAPDAAPDVVIHPGQRCCNLDGESMLERMTHGVRTWGNDPHGSTVFLVGAYEALSHVSERLLRSLPPVLSLSHREWQSPLVSLLCDEVVKDEPGQAAVLDRLLDLLVVAVLKAWFARPDAGEPAWCRSQGDPIVERALRALHGDPTYPWTVGSLAAATGASRASLARRFHDIVGEPPMAFLKNWRLALAADLLCQPDETVGSVAHKVGYSSPFAFSVAFKRARGISPQEHRMSARSLP